MVVPGQTWVRPGSRRSPRPTTAKKYQRPYFYSSAEPFGGHGAQWRTMRCLCECSLAEKWQASPQDPHHFRHPSNPGRPSVRGLFRAGREPACPGSYRSQADRGESFGKSSTGPSPRTRFGSRTTVPLGLAATCASSSYLGKIPMTCVKFPPLANGVRVRMPRPLASQLVTRGLRLSGCAANLRTLAARGHKEFQPCPEHCAPSRLVAFLTHTGGFPTLCASRSPYLSRSTPARFGG